MLQQAVLHNGIKTRTCFILISGDKWNFIIPFCSLSDNCRIGWGNSMRLEALVTCSLISGCTSRQWRHTVHHCRWTVPSHRRSPWPWPAWRRGRRCRGRPLRGRSRTHGHPAAGRSPVTCWVRVNRYVMNVLLGAAQNIKNNNMRYQYFVLVALLSSSFISSQSHNRWSLSNCIELV